VARGREGDTEAQTGERARHERQATTHNVHSRPTTTLPYSVLSSLLVQWNGNVFLSIASIHLVLSFSRYLARCSTWRSCSHRRMKNLGPRPLMSSTKHCNRASFASRNGLMLQERRRAPTLNQQLLLLLLLVRVRVRLLEQTLPHHHRPILLLPSSSLKRVCCVRIVSQTQRLALGCASAMPVLRVKVPKHTARCFASLLRLMLLSPPPLGPPCGCSSILICAHCLAMHLWSSTNSAMRSQWRFRAKCPFWYARARTPTTRGHSLIDRSTSLACSKAEYCHIDMVVLKSASRADVRGGRGRGGRGRGRKRP